MVGTPKAPEATAASVFARRVALAAGCDAACSSERAAASPRTSDSVRTSTLLSEMSLPCSQCALKMAEASVGMMASSAAHRTRIAMRVFSVAPMRTLSWSSTPCVLVALKKSVAFIAFFAVLMASVALPPAPCGAAVSRYIPPRSVGRHRSSARPPTSAGRRREARNANGHTTSKWKSTRGFILPTVAMHASPLMPDALHIPNRDTLLLTGLLFTGRHRRLPDTPT